MKILYIGDIMARPGVETVRSVLPEIIKQYQPELIIAQAENVNVSGKSMSPDDMKELQDLGIHFFSGGNHTPRNEELRPLLENNGQPVIGPANMIGCPGRGWKFAATPKGRVLVISLLGSTVGSPTDITNPLEKIDAILLANKGQDHIATIINFHGDFSSEKRVFGYYVDGRATAVIGDHWHVPTADAMVLPKGTAHITDVGMCGTIHSSLGVKLETIIDRWKDGVKNKNEIEYDGPMQFNAVLIDSNEKGLATSITQIQKTTN